MTTLLGRTDSQRRALATRVGSTGAALGLLAGLVQAVAGTHVPAWTGDKADPLPLGLLTVGLSALALLAAAGLTAAPGRRAATAVGLLVPGLLCFTTVGRLWFVPGALLLAAFALVLASGGVAELVAAARVRWLSVLVSALGAAEVLLAVTAAPRSTALVGVLGGLLLAAAPWLTGPAGRRRLLLAALGTVPFAVLAWTSLLAPLVAVLGLGLLALDGRHSSPRG